MKDFHLTIGPFKKLTTRDFPGGPVVRNSGFQFGGARVCSMIRDLRSCIPSNAAKKKKNKNKNKKTQPTTLEHLGRKTMFKISIGTQPMRDALCFFQIQFVCPHPAEKAPQSREKILVFFAPHPGSATSTGSASLRNGHRAFL